MTKILNINNELYYDESRLSIGSANDKLSLPHSCHEL